MSSSRVQVDESSILPVRVRGPRSISTPDEEEIADGPPDTAATEPGPGLHHNERTLLEKLQSPEWEVLNLGEVAENGHEIVEITTSKMPYNVLNPCIYRMVENAGSLEDIASLLEAPQDWRDRCDGLLRDPVVNNRLTKFKNLSENTHEKQLQATFIGLVSVIAGKLLLDVDSDMEKKVVVGGLLAKYEVDFLCQTDPFFKNPSGQALLATEVKTVGALTTDEMWYHGYKGPRVLAALYGHSCPTFLFSQKYWKVFVEAPDRDRLLTFPFGSIPGRALHINANCFQGMGREFVEAIAICLLSTREPLRPSTPISSNSLSTEGLEASEKIKMTDFGANKGLRSSERAVEERESKRQRQVPPLSFDSLAEQRPASRVLTGYDNAGRPVYLPVRVASPEKVARIVEEIAKREDSLRSQPEKGMEMSR